MKVVAVGTINRDTLVYPDRSRVESFGGLLYTVVSLAHLLPEGVALVPVSNVGGDVFDEVLFKVSRYPNVVLEGLHKVDEPNNHVILHCDTPENKREFLEGGVPPVFLHQVQPWLEDASLVVLNFTSGFDLPLQTAKALRESYKGIVFMDFHSLALGRDRRGARFPRLLPNWRDWVRQADIVQVNAFEAELLAGRPVDTETEAKRLGRSVLGERPQVMLITLGDRGVYVVQRKGRGVVCTHIHGLPVANPVDTTGCGDLFASAFLVGTLEGHPPAEAAAWANRMAAQKCRVRGVDKLDRLLAELAPRSDRAGQN